MNNLLKILGVLLILFLLQSCKKDKPTPPSITTSNVTAISYTTATSGGNLTNEGSSAVLSMGICWNTTTGPNIDNNRTTQNGALGVFVSNIVQLSQNTKYFVRAYATNTAGTSYGNEVTFTTIRIAVPDLATAAITAITQTTAVSGGNIIDENGGPVTLRGVCWSITINPTINDNKTSDGTGTGVYTSTLTELIGNTLYYVRAYATNSMGTAYGNELSFTTTQSTSAFDFKIKNLNPPSEGYNIKEGNCGEAVLWTICQYFGKQLSQQQINYIGGNPGRGLHGNEVIRVLDSLKIPFNNREKADTWENTVDTLRNIIMRGNPIIVGVKIYPDLHPEWYCDHFILFTGTNTLNKVFYYNSVSNSYSITYAKLCDTSNGYSLVNKFNVLFALEILLPH